MHTNVILPALLLTPALLAGVSLLVRSARAAFLLGAAGTLAVAGLSTPVLYAVFTGGPLFAAGKWLMLDALSAYHLAVMMIVFSLSSLYSIAFFDEEIRRGHFEPRRAARHVALWFGTLASMNLVLLSNNLGIMWVGIEATTLLTAFLICSHATPASLEAMWKYLLMCSVGVGMAFMGTILVAALTSAAGLPSTDVLLWSRLMEVVAKLNPMLLKAGFIFAVVGFGTKAGLAPMHNWLPDAHSQAPAPVSAIFSGFMLNAALYCILRYLPLVEAATGHQGWGRGILVLLGILSILVAAVFIVAQHNVKRLLAYSSLEHLGIMSLGVGLGGIGCFAAMFHLLNHSICKTLCFFSAGRLGQACESYDMRQMLSVARVSPAWGYGLIGGLLALIGIGPFSIFVSELLTLKAACDAERFVIAGVFLAGLAIVFIGALRYAISMSWEPSPTPRQRMKTTSLETAMVIGMLAAILTLGVWLPHPLSTILTAAAQVIGDRP